MRTIGYAYDADLHCAGCARDAERNGALKPAGHGPGRMDGNGLHEDLVDREGNPVHPVSDVEEPPLDEEGKPLPRHCGDCGGPLDE